MNEAGHASSTTSATFVADEEAESLQDRVATEGASGDIAEGRTPRRAVSVSIFFALVSVALNWLLPESLLGILLNSVGMVLLVIWVFILVAQIRLHPKLEAEGSIALRSPGWPWLPRLAGVGCLPDGMEPRGPPAADRNERPDVDHHRDLLHP